VVRASERCSARQPGRSVCCAGDTAHRGGAVQSAAAMGEQQQQQQVDGAGGEAMGAAAAEGSPGRQDAGAQQQAAAAGTPSTKPAFPAGLKVLVVDDDPLCLKIIAQMLKTCDYEGACGRCRCFWAGDGPAVVGASAQHVRLGRGPDLLPIVRAHPAVQCSRVRRQHRHWSSCATRATISIWCCQTSTCPVSAGGGGGGGGGFGTCSGVRPPGSVVSFHTSCRQQLCTRTRARHAPDRRTALCG
jgi:hypothetical protein